MTITRHPQNPQDLLAEISKTLQAGDPSTDHNVRQKALRLSTLLTASLQTPSEVAFDASLLPTFSACCRAAVHLHLFEAIAESKGPISASELAAKTGTEHLLVARLLRAITSIGLVAEVGFETYQAIPATHEMASPMFRSLHQHFWDQSAAALIHLPAYLTAQGPRCPTDAKSGLFQYAFNTSSDTFNYWLEQPPPRRALDNFNFLMTCVRGKEPAWLSWFPARERILEGARPGGVVMVDVGGGLGHDVRCFKRKFGHEFPENGRVVLQDLPGVIEDAKKLPDDGLEMVDYNFFTPQVVKGARSYYFAHILHDWSGDAAAQIIANVKSAMEPGYSKLFFFDFILPDTGVSRLHAAYDINMMSMHAGMERTKTQWTTLLEAAGLKVTKFWMAPDETEDGIVEAELMQSEDRDGINGVNGA